MADHNNKSLSPIKSSTSHVKKIRYIILLIVLGLAIHLLFPQIATFQHSYQVIRNMLVWAIILAALAQIISYIGSGYLLRSLVHFSKYPPSISRSVMIAMASASFGIVAGGIVGTAAATYGWMKKEKVSNEAATLAGTIPGLFNNVVLIIISTFGLIYLLLAHELSRLELLGFVITLTGLIVIIGLIIWGLIKRESFTRIMHRLSGYWARLRHKTVDSNKTSDWLTGVFRAADALIAGGWRGSLIGAVINTVFDMLTLYFIFIAANNQVSIGILLIGYGLPLLLGKIAFIIPGGVGVIETAMVGLYTELGVPNPTAVVVVLAYRLISFWLPLITGFIMVPILQGKHRRLSSP
jgi:glycosyltransferase 2 family protein